jgi:hypothetical protein
MKVEVISEKYELLLENISGLYDCHYIGTFKS